MPQDRIHLTIDAAPALAERALAGLGYNANDAIIIADHVVGAALCGCEYSGLAKILNVADSPRFTAPRPGDVGAARDGGFDPRAQSRPDADIGDIVLVLPSVPLASCSLLSMARSHPCSRCRARFAW